jgi:cystathionine beta-lyase
MAVSPWSREEGMSPRSWVTIVSGAPRSGTSLAMQVLAAGGIPACSDGARSPDRSNPRGYLEHRALRRLGDDPAADEVVRRAAGLALKVVHARVERLPEGPAYRVLWMERSVADVVASQSRMLRAQGLAEDEGLGAERLAEVLVAQLAEARAALEARDDVRLLPVDSAGLAADPVAASRAIAAFLGGGLDQAAMARAVVPGLFGRSGGYTAAVSDVMTLHAGPLELGIRHREPPPTGGPSLYVRAGGAELLRFDAVARDGHVHIDPKGRDERVSLGLEVETLEWTLAELRRDLPGWLARAGFRGAVPEAELARALDALEPALRNPPPEFDALREPVLRARSGEKWHEFAPDVQALWVADMDFEVAEPIRRRLQRALDVGDLGYPIHPAPTPLPGLFAERMQRLFGWTVDPGLVELTTDVMQAMYVAIQQLTDPGDGLIVQTPIYPPFLGAVRELKRELLENPLREGEGGYHVDVEDLRAKAAGARMILICNPHNPTGRVFRREELVAIAEVALEHDLWIVSDEIHEELVYPGARHVPIASLSEQVAARTVTLTSASKPFNIAGLRCAQAVFGSADLRRRYRAVPRKLRGGLGNLGLLAVEAAWRHADPWLADCLAYLQANRDFLAEFVGTELPGVRHFRPEATYLAWLDCRALGLDPSPHRFFLEQAKVGLSNGPSFGSQGEGYVRINFATSRALLEEALGKMAKALR